MERYESERKKLGKEKRIKSLFKAKKNRLLPTRLAVDFCETKNKRAVEERVYYNITGKVIVLMRISFPCAKEVNLKGTTTDTTTSTLSMGFTSLLWVSLLLILWQNGLYHAEPNFNIHS